MALFYKATNIESEDVTTLEGIQVHEGDPAPNDGPYITYDFSKHVLIELLDNVTPEPKLWKELGLVQNKNVSHKRLLADPHRKNCRRAIVVCTSSDAAKEMAQRLTQSKIKKRCICAVVIQELLFDLRMFEKQIIKYGDKGSQHQFVYVRDLNRPREPASLARYLREKFSPFGTILSVFVAEGKDGYALPEGVIRYAHLSEAFAAELAYDQCAVAMERLTVSTHHNILLSQCDLKTRLKAAKLQFSKEVNSCESDCGATAPKESDPALNDHGSVLGRDGGQSKSSSVISDTPMEPNTNNVDHANTAHASPAVTQKEFPTDSAELDNALKNSCNENLIDCLKCITMDSESSFSKQTSTAAASGSEAQEMDQEIPQSSSPITVSRDRSWSSRIMGWITDIPSADDMHRFHDNLEDHSLSERSVGHQPHEESQTRDMPLPMDIVSNSGSFVTCKNGDVTASYNSNPPSPASTVRYDTNSPNGTLQLQRLSSPAKSHVSAAENRHSPESVRSFLRSSDICPPFSSQKRKNSSMMTQKLLIKSQRLDSSRALSEASESETTVHLPSVSSNRQCYVVLNSLPELNELAKSFMSKSTNADVTVVSAKKSSVKSQLPVSSVGLQHCPGNPALEASSSKSSSSLPVRRSSRRTNNSDSQKPSSVCSDSSSRKVAPLTSNFHGQRDELLDGKEESPLQLMLKNELKSSTASKDASISVGCSHMTCDFCYPDSDKLLLECF